MAFVSCDQLLGSADDIVMTEEKPENGGMMKYVLLFTVGLAGGYLVAGMLRRKK